MTQASTLQDRMDRARETIASWSQEKLRMMQLQGASVFLHARDRDRQLRNEFVQTCAPTLDEHTTSKF